MVQGKRNFTAFTGIKNFSYGVLDGNKIVGEKATVIEFLQEVAISTEQELIKAFGDNKVAEMAVSTGTTALTTTFHTLPIEDKAVIYGMIENEGIWGMPGSPNPPYVACMFTKTREDGSTEHVGLTKGKFMLADEEAVTKGETIDFGVGTTEGEFMERKIVDYDKELSFLVAKDEPGSVTERDKLYKMIYGVPFPVEGA